MDRPEPAAIETELTVVRIARFSVDRSAGPSRLAAGECVDLSVWDDAAALHAAPSPGTEASPGTVEVAWWVADRVAPTVADGWSRLEFLERHGPSPYAFAPSDTRAELTIDRVWLDDTDVQVLINQLNADLYSRYPEPGALVFSLHPEDIVDGVGALLMAVLNGRPVGCGAFLVLADQPATAEIKRMYVSLAGRGHKIGAALLVELERRALQLGVRRFVLEAGPRQPEALHRFGQAGYVECAPWGAFIDKDLSICMAKIVAT